MKKLYFYILMLMPVFTLTSCEDAEIASTLEGTWKGNMYISSRYGNVAYEATYTEITFEIDPFYFSKGSGYWVDYYDTGRYRDISRDYVANHIDWEVNNRTIYIHFREDDTSVVISDYHLNDSRFSGYIADGDNDVYFNLVHTSSPNWDNYNNWGYDPWCEDDYYYARQTRGAAVDSTAAKPAKPVRQFGKKE